MISYNTALVFSYEILNDMKIIKSLEESGLLVKKKNNEKMKQNNKKADFAVFL